MKIFLIILLLTSYNLNKGNSFPEETCGIPQVVEDDLRVINGGDSTAEQAPWHVILEKKKKQNTEKIVAFCGGNIISNRLILTAAHCVWGNSNSPYCPNKVRNLKTAEECHNFRKNGRKGCPSGCTRIRPVDLNVYFGITDIRQSKRISIPVKKIHIHYGWGKNISNTINIKLGHDLSLLELVTPLIYSATIQPICLPVQTFNISIGSHVKVNGFGSINPSIVVLPDNLQSAVLQILAKGDCSGIQGDQVCAGSGSGVDSCKGDSGGGLIQTFDDGSGQIKHVLIGIVSYGSRPCGSPAVYTNVKSHLAWIGDVVSCETISGPDAGTSCVFPFIFKNTIHSGCTWADALEGKAWCSTLVDEQGVHVGKAGRWGHCAPGCKTEKGDEVIYITGGSSIDTTTGGNTVGTTTEVLDVSGSSSPCSPSTGVLPERRYWHSMNMLGDSLVICGGYGDNSTATSCVSSRNVSGPWLPHSTTNSRRTSHSGVSTINELHLVGGLSGTGATMATFSGGVWTEQDLPYDIGPGSCSVQTSQNSFIITGGIGAPSKVLEWSDGSWQTLVQMKIGRWYHACGRIRVGDKVFIVVSGGWDSDGNTVQSTEIYDIEDQSWQNMGDSMKERRGASIVTVRVGGSQKMFIMGGVDNNGNTLNSMEELLVNVENLSESAWKLSEVEMKEERSRFGAVAIPKNSVCN